MRRFQEPDHLHSNLPDRQPVEPSQATPGLVPCDVPVHWLRTRRAFVFVWLLALLLLGAGAARAWDDLMSRLGSTPRSSPAADTQSGEPAGGIAGSGAGLADPVA